MSNSFECPGPVHAQRFRFKIEEAKVREIRVASGCCCGGAIRRSQSLSAIPVVAQLWHRYTHNTRSVPTSFRFWFWLWFWAAYLLRSAQLLEVGNWSHCCWSYATCNRNTSCCCMPNCNRWQSNRLHPPATCRSYASNMPISGQNKAPALCKPPSLRCKSC